MSMNYWLKTRHKMQPLLKTGLKPTFIVESEGLEPVPPNGEKAAGHDRGRMGSPDVGLLGSLLITELVPANIYSEGLN